MRKCLMLEEYLKIQKENFTKDGQWTTPQELAQDQSTIPKVWLKEHDENPDFWNILLKDIKQTPNFWDGKRALEYGIGFGGNLVHLLKLANWEEVVGYDISKSFVDFTEEYLKCLGYENFSIYETNGADLDQTPDNYLDFIMSFTVLQHIAPYDIRFHILEEFYRTLRTDGILSFQMNMDSGIPYYSNDWKKASRPNCKVKDPVEVVKDLEKIGFKNITYLIRSNPRSSNKNTWVYFRAEKG